MITFVEGRDLPREFTRNDLGQYGDVLQDIGNIVQKASPWDFLKGTFVDKPIAEQQAQLAIAQQQAQVASEVSYNRTQTTRTAIMVGAGLLGLLALVMVVRRPAAARVAGYRRSRRRSRR